MPKYAPLSDEERLYLDYLKTVEGYAWFRTHYPGEAYANETLENIVEARKHWDAALVVEPIGEPAPEGKRDGFAYVTVTFRRRNDILANDLTNQRRVLTAVEKRGKPAAFAAALRRIVRANLGPEATEDEVLWACLNAPPTHYFRAAIDAVTATED